MNNLVKRALSIFSHRSRWAALRASPRAVLNARAVAVAAALMGPVALFIPWVSLDGHAGPLSGVGLMAYALDGNDRLVMWRISPLATALLLVLPFVITAGVAATAVNVLRRDCRLDAPLFAAAAILLLLRFVPPILSTHTLTVGDFALPGWGLAILLAAILTVIAVSLGQAFRRWLTPVGPSPSSP